MAKLRLESLLSGPEVARIEGSADPEIGQIDYDSRKVEGGSLFVAIPGARDDGHRHVEEAIRRGARAVVWEKPFALSLPASHVTFIQVPDARRALARLAARFYGHPAERLTLIGITGTNGKTTTAHLVESILKAAGHPVGYIGTLGYRCGNHLEPTGLTTPEAPDLQRILWEMVEQGASHVVLEVSSHSLTLHRVEGCRFPVGVFTNLTGDHLDFHGTMEEYFSAKQQLFREPGAEVAVINADDPWGRSILDGSSACPLTYGLDSLADIRARDIQLTQSHLSFTARIAAGEVALESSLIGRHNLYNILAAIGVSYALGLDGEQVQQGIRALKGVPGRFERVEAGQGFAVVVDYAHTDDALHRLLLAARELTPGRLILVFGCGGDRDRSKRPRMGEVAARRSDYAIITSDNPRSEEPEAIIREIESGFRQAAPDPGRYEVTVDRQQAIRRAISLARPGDTVVLAGKGHETYQILKDRVIHFDDREVARQAIQNQGSGVRDQGLGLATQ